MMLEYYNKPESTVTAWQDLWFHTGDYLQCDPDGYYYFVDRKKDAIRRRGENISSFEVESLVNRYPDVLESAAVPVPSEIGEDDVMICVVAKGDTEIDPAALHAYCREQMADFMLPRYIRTMPQIPKTPTQKVQKYQLRQTGVTVDTWDALNTETGTA
jgi:crotonobetaine/carnitine-CoA ligase